MTSFYLHRDAGTELQVKWPERIELHKNARFDLRNASQGVAGGARRGGSNQYSEVLAVSEDKRGRAEEDGASYLIHEWQALRDQARRMIIYDALTKDCVQFIRVHNRRGGESFAAGSGIPSDTASTFEPVLPTLVDSWRSSSRTALSISAFSSECNSSSNRRSAALTTSR